MYKKGGLLMLIGLGIMVLACVLLVLNFKSIQNISLGNGEVVTKEIAIEDSNTFHLNTKDDKVIFIKGDTDKITVKYYETEYKVYDFIKEDGIITLRKRDTGFRLFSLDFSFLNSITTVVTLPETSIENMKLSNSNAEVSLEHYPLNTLEITTSNGKINLKDISVINPINLTTSNSAISLENINVPKATINTSNGSISISQSVIPVVKAITSNSSITLDNTEIEESLNLKSSNGAISFGKTAAKDIIISTSNAKINGTIHAIRGEYNEEFNTSNSTICINEDNFSDKRILKKYEKAFKNIDLQTTNGKIKIDYILEGKENI